MPRVSGTGKTQFTAGSINGLSISAAGGARGNLADGAGQVEIKSGSLTGGGTAFVTTWIMSCSVAAGQC